MKKFYLYRHVRLDKNEVFYIGIGSKSKKDMTQDRPSRALNFKKRNRFWMSVYNKTKIEVEIVLESDDYDFIKQKEIEFIKLYGRKDLGLGTLVNMTDGGELNQNKTISQETKDKIRNALKGRKPSVETRLILSEKKLGNTFNKGRKLTDLHIKNRSLSLSKKILQCDMNEGLIKEWDSIKLASDMLKINAGHISSCCKNKRKSAGKYKWKYK